MSDNGDSLTDSSDFTTQLRRLIPYVIAGLGVIFIGVGILINYIRSNQSSVVVSVASNETSSVAGKIKVKLVVVDVSGAVEKPGVYSIPYNSRISDVLITAGGLSANADRNYVSRYINLAQVLTDGMKIYFPYDGETTSNSVTKLPSNQIKLLVNINTATVTELDALPGIGVVTANKILNARPYQNIAELVSRGVVSKAVFEKIKSEITAP